MDLITALLTVLAPSGVVTPTNTVAPSIAAASVIGTQIIGDDGTWTGSPTFTYQWQRGGVDIGGATSKNYTPVDADFGQALRLVVTPSSGSPTNSNATNLTQEAPAQSFNEVVVNGNFSSGSSGANPPNWTLTGNSGADPNATITATDGSAGTGACRFVSSATSAQPRISQNVLVSGSYYESSLNLTQRTSGGYRLDLGASSATPVGGNITTTGIRRGIARAVAVTLQFLPSTAAPIDFVVDDISTKLITLNGELTAPSANMRISQFFTLPVSPVALESIWIMPRLSDFTSGNYWLILLQYTGSQWDITLYSVASHTRTSRTSASNIGTTNGVRINMNGNLIDLQTTADGGSNWTNRGSQVNNSTYNTAANVNVIANSTFTLGNMQYEAAV